MSAVQGQEAEMASRVSQAVRVVTCSSGSAAPSARHWQELHPKQVLAPGE
jgi:hypothetical protein